MGKNKSHHPRKKKELHVKAIYGARTAESDDSSAPPSLTPSPSPVDHPPPSDKLKPRNKPAVQLLRPVQLADATIKAVTLVDSRLELVRNFGPIEKCLREQGTLYRTVAVLGRAQTGRSTLLSWLLETTSARPKSQKFTAHSASLDVYVHPERRIMAIKTPAVEGRGDVRFAYSVLASCHCVLLVLEEGEPADSGPVRLAAQALALLLLPRAPRLVLVRNRTPPGFSGLRRVQADEAAARLLLPQLYCVLHVPAAPGPELDRALFALRAACLGRLPQQQAWAPPSETDWLQALIQAWAESDKFAS